MEMTLRMYRISAKVIWIVLLTGFLGHLYSQSPSGWVPRQVHALEREGLPFRIIEPFTDQTATQRQQLPEPLVGEGLVLQPDMDLVRSVSRTRPPRLDLRIPAPDGGTWILRLFRVHPAKEGMEVRYADGRPAHGLEGAYYRGMILGDDRSLVALSFFADHLRGFVSNDAGNHVLGPMETRDARSWHVFYNDRAIAHLQPRSCVMDEVDLPTRDKRHNQDAPGRASDCVSMYWEVDFDVFQNQGNNTANFISGMAHEVYTLYDNDGITLETSQIFIWSVPSPYNGPTSLLFLTQFRNQYNGNFFGDLGHLVNFKGSGGIAYLGGLCNPPSNCAYSSIFTTYQNVPNYSWTINVTAHEIGHNLGSEHTHACAWNGNDTRIDNCGGNAGYPEGNCNSNPPNPVNGGTVMSYCHLVAGVGINFNEGFGPQPSLLMIDNINGAFCLQGCGNPPPCSFFIVCPPAITVECDADRDPWITGEPVIELTGNCNQEPQADWTDMTQGLNGCNGTGNLIRTWIASEEGFTASCTQTITVVDRTAPEFLFIQPDLTIQCYELTPDPFWEVQDNCGQPSVFVQESVQPGNCLYNFVILRTYQAWDNCNNATSAVQRITVRDTNAPEFSSGNPTELVYTCDEQIPVIQPAVSDSCAQVTLSFEDRSLPTGDCPLERFVRRWTATDQCQNTATFEVTIEWTDSEPPMARCRPDTIVLLSGEAVALDPLRFDDGSFDACTAITMGITPASVDCGTPGAREVLLTVADACDNRDTCVTSVTVIAPQARAEATVTDIGPAQFRFDASGSDGQVFAWTFGDGQSGMGAIVEHLYLEEGDFEVLLVVEDTACGHRDTLVLEVMVVIASMDPGVGRGLRVYPNPSDGVFTVVLSDPLPGAFSWEVVNALGQTVHVMSPEALSSGPVTRWLDLRDAPSGWYHLIVRSGDSVRRMPLLRR